MKISWTWSGITLCLLVLGELSTGCSYLPKGRPAFEARTKEQGIASWYGDSFHGQVTANGEVYDEQSLTGAHRTLPFGTVVKVTNANNGLQVRIRINDRGPYVGGRVLDLSYAAATELELTGTGIAPVNLEVVGLQNSSLTELPVWKALGTLMRRAVSSEVSGTIADSADHFGQAFLTNLRVPTRSSRPQTPRDIALERRLRREADAKTSDAGEEGNSETELI